MCSSGITRPVMESLLKKTRCMYNHPVRYLRTVDQPRGGVWASARLCDTCHMLPDVLVFLLRTANCAASLGQAQT